MKQEKKDLYIGYQDIEQILAEYDHLPVANLREVIREQIRLHPNFVLVGETGSGKTTCLPLLLLELRNELGLKGRIGVTQPRRVAARGVTYRVSDMVDSEVGDQAGYHIRFENVTSRQTDIVFMTDGILLRKIQHDPYLLEYSAIMFDEVHEKNNNIYLCLGLIKQVNRLRAEMGIEPIIIVVASATFETEKFARYIGEEDTDNAIEVPGKMFPVEISYQRENLPDDGYIQGAADKVREIVEKKIPGNILIFVPGKEEIRRTIAAIESEVGYGQLEILPLHSELSSEEQDLIFEPTDKRLIIVATQLGETSLTFPDLNHVISSGLVKEIHFDPKTGIEQLRLVECSLSSLKQQSGRAGRTSAGFCHYLFPQENLRRRHRFHTPEIQRSNLTELVLVMKAMEIADIRDFDFVDKPHQDLFLYAEDTLYSLGAIDEYGELTEAGELMANLRIKPEYGAMIVETIKSGPDSLNEICTLAALLNGKNIFSRPSNRDEAKVADRAHDDFYSKESSDFSALLNIWRGYARSGYDKDWAIANYLNDRALEEARKVRLELIEVLESRKIYVNQNSKSHLNKDVLGKAITAGLINNLLRYDGKTFKKIERYKGDVEVHPDSLFYGRNFEAGTLLVASEVFMTNEKKVYASKCLQVKQEWVKEIAPDLLAKIYKNKDNRKHNFGGGRSHSHNIFSRNQKRR